MKVLLPIIWHELTHCVARAFEAQGHDVRVVDWRQHQKRHKNRIVPEIIAAAEAFRPDLVFCQFQSPGIINSVLPLRLRDLGCFTINWTGDVREPLPQWYMDLAPFFDVTSFTNWPDVDQVRAMGHCSEFLQIGYDSRLYYPSDAQRSGVVFIGNNYGDRYPQSATRRAMCQAMAEAFGDAFIVHGVGWEGVLPSRNVGGYLREPADADVLRRSLVAVGMDHFFRPGFASDRLLRATACGCAVVQWHYEGIEQEHPYVESVTSIGEMLDKVADLLVNYPFAHNLGALNAGNTLASHGWENRVKRIETWMR